MIPFFTVITILFMHYVADFRWQTPWQAENKSKNNWALITHVMTYTVGLFLCAPMILPDVPAAIWVGYNAVMHFLVDYVSSRESSRRFGQWHDFFETIGGDQFLHYVTLFMSYVALS